MDLVLVLAAVVPAIILLVRIYKADRLEKEPIGMLLMLALFGILSTILATFLERLGEAVVGAFAQDGSLMYNILINFGVIAFAEEGSKYLVLKNRSWKSPNFDCSFDGVVYAVFVSLGFALWENILYVFAYGMSTAAARAVTAVPGHACFGVFMGAWYGMAKRYDLAGDHAASARARRLSVLLPALIHGAYDFIASMDTDWLLVIFLVFVVALFVISLRLVKRLARTDEYITPPEEKPLIEKLFSGDGDYWDSTKKF